MRIFFQIALKFPPVAWIAVAMALSTQTNSGQSSPTTVTNEQAVAFVSRLEHKSPPYTQWDTNGNLVRVFLNSNEAKDTNLALLSAIGSIRTIFMTPKLHGRDGLTRDGFSTLGRLTNLTVLGVGCAWDMPPGILEEICNLKGLRTLDLNGSYPRDKAEYGNFQRLKNLEELRIAYCTNFGGRELGTLTNLTHLKRLTVDLYSGSSADTNILSRLNNLTKLEVDFVRK